MTDFLGHSSNYSYTQRVLRLLHSRFSDEPYPTWHPHGASNLGWDGVRGQLTPDIDSLPSLDHAIFLINAVKFHAGQIYHLFDDITFTQQLNSFYSSPAEKAGEMRLWYIHFLILIAFGKAFIVGEVQTTSPPGANLFIHAVQSLPAAAYLIQDFITSAEILCCIALYYLAVVSRISAYDKIGQAVRLGILSGMPTPMQGSIDDDQIQRYRKSWWTIVVLDRQISAYLGLPLQIQDDDITAPFPVFAESEQRKAAIGIQIRLSRAMSVVMNSM
ncbi:Zn(II)2Cys6 transcription factor [Fusarium albosuccineum]|uniref:Zn(II)2Cys6 transcription factor n=1 Tax=Fusarium albosuccineum TaxID=1237068 RepID=A0A8H4L6Z5_9HYPO|nr:Zn(II)2Cys6 transcription factor [Fusarium albosuccineum]